MVLTHLRSSSLLPQPYMEAKLDPSWSPLGQECLLLFAWQILFKGTSTAQKPLQCLHNTWSIAPLSHLLGCSLATCYVSASLTRLGPLGSEQRLSQCESSSVSATKMPNKDCGFITYGREGPHTGRWQGSQRSHS